MSKKKTSVRPLAALVVGAASLVLVTGCGEQPESHESYAYPCQADLDHSATPSVTDEAPAADSWTSGKDGVQYPVSTKFGGCESLNSGWKVGHAHNTAGALYAATDFLAGPTGKELEHASADDLTKVYASGAVRDQIIANAAKPKTPEPTGEGYMTESPDSDISAQLRGYEVQEQDADKVRVLLYGQSDAVFSGTFGFTMVWQDGDWKVDPVSAERPMDLQMTATSDPAVTWSA